MRNEQKLFTVTTIHFDFFDRLRVLFGAKVHVRVETWVPIEQEIPHYNASATCVVDGLTKFSFFQDKPGYGYTHSPKLNNDATV